MADLIGLLKTGYRGLTENGQFLMLFMAALLFFWLLREFEKKEFRMLATVLLLLLLCPVSIKLLLLYQTGFYRYENIWALLPVTAVLACGAVMAVSKIQSVYLAKQKPSREPYIKRERVCEASAMAAFVLLLFLCGTLEPAKRMGEWDTGGDRMPAEAAEVLKQLEIPAEEEVFLLAPDEVAAWARIYSGNILLPYGRNLWEPELSAYVYDTHMGDAWELHNWVNGTLATGSEGEEALREEEMVLSRCASAGYDYLVFSAERNSGEGLRLAMENQKEYAYFAETERYVIYRLQ